LAASSVAPGSTSAAASATLGVPTARRTTSLGLGTGTAASRPAGKVTTGQPRSAAAASKPGSSAFTSAVAIYRTDSADSPSSASVPSMSWPICSAGAPRLAPTPTSREGGW